MKTKGRPKSKNIVDRRNAVKPGVYDFLAESLAMAPKNYKVPLPRKRPNVEKK